MCTKAFANSLLIQTNQDMNVFAISVADPEGVHLVHSNFPLREKYFIFMENF